MPRSLGPLVVLVGASLLGVVGFTLAYLGASTAFGDGTGSAMVRVPLAYGLGVVVGAGAVVGWLPMRSRRARIAGRGGSDRLTVAVAARRSRQMSHAASLHTP